jgi:hypothetical protein
VMSVFEGPCHSIHETRTVELLTLCRRSFSPTGSPRSDARPPAGSGRYEKRPPVPVARGFLSSRLVLARMFEPGRNHECLDHVADFGDVFEYTPIKGAIAPALIRQLPELFDKGFAGFRAQYGPRSASMSYWRWPVDRRS